jgi:transposase
MRDATTLLFGLDGFRVVRVDVHDENDPEAPREVLIEGVEHEQACPACGVLSSKVHARKVRPVKDLPHGSRPLRVRWDQRRWACQERACRRRTFAETSAQISRGQRLTRRLREQLERAVPGSTRSAADVARKYGVSWWSVNSALVVAAASMTPQAPVGVRLLGVDETRARSVRWLLAEAGWRRSDPWMTSFVDLDPAHPGGCWAWPPGGQEPASAGGLTCRASSSATALRSSPSIRPHRSPRRCARCCRPRRWSWTTGTCTGWPT